MQLAPASYSFTAVFGRGPLALANNLEAGAVDNEKLAGKIKISEESELANAIRKMEQLLR